MIKITKEKTGEDSNQLNISKLKLFRNDYQISNFIAIKPSYLAPYKLLSNI